MTKLTEGFITTSTAAGAEVFSLTSTEEETKHANRIHVHELLNHKTLLTIWLEREKIADAIPLEEIATVSAGFDILLDVDIPVGQTLKGILTDEVAASHGILSGWLEYELK